MIEVEADYDIAVIGCGPVGAIAANLFGKAGLRTLVIERQAELYPLPRAVHIDHEIMRVLASIGLAERMLPLMRETDGHIHIGADGGVIRYLGSKGLTKRYGWANDYFFFQPELEAALRDGMQRFASVATWVGTELVALKQANGRVVLVAETAGSAPRQVAARYVVACDGANSFVRKALGEPLVDLQFEEPWLVVDAEVDGPIRLPDFTGVPADADLQHLSLMVCDPHRPRTLVPGRGNHRRWEFMLLQGEDDAAMMQPERVEALLAPYVRDVPHRIVRAATYRFHGLLAARWQDARIFLAGDAAHQTPPFFGQGMCHGVRDVANLAWKLAAILKQQADPALLETYQVEREPHVRSVIGASIAAGRYICERDPAAARRRDKTLRAALGKPTPRSASDLIPALCAGVVDAHRDKGPGTGARFIQPFVARQGQRVLLDEATGGGFALVVLSDALLGGLSDADKTFWAEVGRSFVVGSAGLLDIDGGLAAWLAEQQAAAVLLRPDFYVYGTAWEAAGVARLIRQLGAIFGKLPRNVAP
jgi:3-(3-hydroxy-phenyl)propionate hydroxylase